MDRSAVRAVARPGGQIAQGRQRTRIDNRSTQRHYVKGTEMLRRIQHLIHWRKCSIIDRWGIADNPPVVLTRFHCGHIDRRMGDVYDAVGPYNEGSRSTDRCGDGCLLWGGHDGPHFTAAIGQIL